MSKKKVLLLSAILYVLITFSFSILNIALADGGGSTLPETASNCPAGAVCLDNPLGPGDAAKSSQILLGKIINSVLGIIGSLALVMFIYGGVAWMLSGGNQERVAQGKRILIWATLGILIIFSAYALVKFVITTVAGSGT